MLYSHNKLLIFNTAHDVLYEFNPFDALQLCKKKLQEHMLLQNILERIDEDQAEAPSVDGSHNDNDILNNSINLLPSSIQVEESKLWKAKDMTKIEDLTTIE